jgi:catechol 2,3-dioxygenase-like lactoylglutathione lyase family enzyme
MAKILQHHYVLAVPDAHASAKFFVEVLGFAVSHDGDGWVFVSRDACMIMLGTCPDDLPPRELGSHSYFAYLRVDDVDAVYAGAKGQGVDLLSGPTDKPWGMREFVLRTPDGHRLMIGQPVKG